MYDTILISNDVATQNQLKKLLGKYCPELSIIDTALSEEEAFLLITEKQPQLLFLNTNRSEAQGFDLLSKLPKQSLEVIFVAADASYAVEAIKFHPAGYLILPILPKDLITVVHHAIERINLKEENKRNQKLLNNLSQPYHHDNRIGIPTIDGLEFIPVKSIIRCEGMQRCTRIILLNDKSMVSSYNLGEFKKLLTGYNFFSPHKSHIINLIAVRKYSKEGIITMSDGSTVPVARRKKQEFLEQMTKH